MSTDGAERGRQADRTAGLDGGDLEREQVTDLPDREVLTIIENPLIGGSITAGPTTDSSSGTSGGADPLGFTGSSGGSGGSDTSGTSTITGESTTGGTGTATSDATQVGTQTASDGTALMQEQTTDATASSADGPYQPQQTSVSQT